MKRVLRIYIEQDDIKKLREKAEQSGFTGKGAISHYIEKIARESIAFLDNNLMAFVKSLKMEN